MQQNDSLARLDAQLGTVDKDRLDYLANGKANIMQGLGCNAVEAEKLMYEQGYMRLEECSRDTQTAIASERRAIVADLVREHADRWDCEEREAMYRLCVGGELGANDVPPEVWQRVIDRSLGGLQYG